MHLTHTFEIRIAPNTEQNINAPLKLNCTKIKKLLLPKIECHVKVPPKITPFEFAKDVNVGDRVSVQCVVGTGDLPLTFHWYKDDMALSSGPMNDDKSAKKFTSNGAESLVTIRQNDEFSSALSINSLQPNQGGTYKCIVENDAAKETYSALLRVNGKIQMKQPQFYSYKFQRYRMIILFDIVIFCS